MKRLGLLLSWLLALGCGARPSGPAPGQTYFWQVLNSEVGFGTCSDDALFRAQLMPLKFEPNTFVTYKVEPDGKTAVSQTCARVDPSTCKPSETKIVFTVANPELIFSSQSKTAFGTGGCQLLDTTTWTLTDKNPIGTLEIAHVFSLVDNPTECARAEAQFKQQSPNMLGLEGCVVTFKVGLSLE